MSLLLVLFRIILRTKVGLLGPRNLCSKLPAFHLVSHCTKLANYRRYDQSPLHRRPRISHITCPNRTTAILLFVSCMSTHNFTLHSHIARQYSPRRAPDVCIRSSGWVLGSRTSIARLTSTPSHVIFDTTPLQTYTRSCHSCTITLQHD